MNGWVFTLTFPQQLPTMHVNAARVLAVYSHSHLLHCDRSGACQPCDDQFKKLNHPKADCTCNLLGSPDQLTGGPDK